MKVPEEHLTFGKGNWGVDCKLAATVVLAASTEVLKKVQMTCKKSKYKLDCLLISKKSNSQDIVSSSLIASNAKMR